MQIGLSSGRRLPVYQQYADINTLDLAFAFEALKSERAFHNDLEFEKYIEIR